MGKVGGNFKVLPHFDRENRGIWGVQLPLWRFSTIQGQLS